MSKITFEQIKINGIGFMSEYEGFYYVRPKKVQYYDNTMYKVNIKTEEVELFDLIDYGFMPVKDGKSLEELATVLIEPSYEVEALE